MKKRLALVVMALACIGLAGTMACGQSQEAVATRVVTEWVTDNPAAVSQEMTRLVIGAFPLLAQVSGDFLVDRIEDSATWTYDEPECESDDRCRVTATASTTIDVSLPLLGDRRYVASLPFSLLVNTGARTVLRWTPQPLDASVEELPG